MTLQFERKFTLILLFVFLTLTVIGFSLYQSTVSIQQAKIWQRQANETQTALDEITTDVLEASSGVDSFVVTGNDSYLSPYSDAKKKIEQNIAKLRAQDETTEVAVDELDRLTGFVTAIFERLAGKVALRKSAGYEAAILELSNASERTTIANIRAAITRAKAAEATRLQQREQQLDRSLSNTIAVLILSCIAGLASLAFANVVVFRETAKRSRAEQALVEANRGLEERIAGRTSELVAANSDLQTAAEERTDLLAKEYRARREAEVANRLRDEFMATISHELRTPLNSILGWSRLMRGNLSAEQNQKAIDTIILNAELQNRLIEDLLDVARIISGKLELDRREIDLAETVDAAIDTMRPVAGPKKIDLNSIFPVPSVPLVIVGDKNRIEQILLNLLTNAIKFSPEGGTVTVRVEPAGENVEIGVIDDGIGIKPEFLPLVFERFRQDASAAAQSGGLGLGLAIVRNLVELHGGTVSVRSDGAGRGSEFVVLLPLKAAANRGI